LGIFASILAREAHALRVRTRRVCRRRARFGRWVCASWRARLCCSPKAFQCERGLFWQTRSWTDSRARWWAGSSSARWATDALRSQRKPLPGQVHHSDRGMQVRLRGNDSTIVVNTIRNKRKLVKNFLKYKAISGNRKYFIF
jgi:hypothetical protein